MNNGKHSLNIEDSKYPPQMSLFLNNAFLFYRNAHRILSDSQMSFATVGKTGADWDSAPEQTGTLLMLQS